LTVSKGKKLMDVRKFVVTVNNFFLFYDMQSVRAVQGYTTALYEPANWDYIEPFAGLSSPWLLTGRRFTSRRF